MLERYENDTRIGIVSGLNHFEKYDFFGNSYGFVKSAGIWGWATWKSRWNLYTERNYNLENFGSSEINKLLKYDITPKRAAIKRLNIWQQTKKNISKGQSIS
jgi:hypothetical protein